MKESVYRKLYKRFKQSNGVSTDTRTINQGEVFFALKGPNFNANDFARDAISKGAALAVVDSPETDLSQNEDYIVVDDSLKALQWLASEFRKEFDIPLIGLTGSNGKTTTKELINAVLSRAFKSYATPGNLNNHIGVPLSILSMPKDTEIAVIEMGANHIGEIDLLCRIAQPTHGLITNVGKDHLEGFGSFEGSLRANSELYQYLIEHGGVAFINSSDTILNNMARRFERPVLYPGKSDYSYTEYIGSDPFIKYRAESGAEVKTQLIGKYNFNNIATALCLGKYFSVPEIKANEAVTGYQPKNNRSEWKKTGKNLVLLDAYNANPSSMEVALESFLEMEGNRKAVILGDMFELGQYSDTEHRDLGKKLAGSEISKIILCGKAMSKAADQISNAEYFETKKELLEYLQNNSLKDYLILIKASRGMALEDCLPYL